ncbi:MAG: response regulator, partial [Armatimonadetes bacterium]|nr:response regulator [Anaerolineae bacterium]
MTTTNPIARTIFAGWDVALVEDDPSSLDIAQMMLRHYGANVHSALNGQEGVLLVQAVMPKIIITDISMPIMDGWELIAQIKAEPRTAHIPIIALTAHAMPGDRER